MKRFILILSVILIGVASSSGLQAEKLSKVEIVAGLKEALELSTKESVNKASKFNGFYKNPRLFIPFPEDADEVKNTMNWLKKNYEIDTFVMKMNRAAEAASKNMTPAFLAAIKNLKIKKGDQILNGPDDAATKYFESKDHDKLFYDLKPTVQKAMDEVGVDKVWNPIITTYNQLPEIELNKTNINEYITRLTIKGLFTLMAAEEEAIRTKPSARVTPLLRKVFADQS